MDMERLVVRLVADAGQYLQVLDFAEARLINFAASVTEQVTMQSMKLASSYERAEIAFEIMAGTADKAKKLLNDITNLAIETPFKSEELIRDAKQLQAFGVDIEQIVPILEMLGNVSAGTGGHMDRIILAFGQVRTAGRLMGQELRQFTNAGIPMMEHLAAVMGKPVDEITHLVHTGQVGFSDVVNAFKHMTKEGSSFAGMMERVNKETISGRWESFNEKLQVTGRNLGLGLFRGFHLGTGIDWLTNLLGPTQDKEFVDKQLNHFIRVFGEIRAIIITSSHAAYEFWEAIDASGKANSAYRWILSIKAAIIGWSEENTRLVQGIALVTVSYVGFVASTRVAVLVLGIATRAVNLLRLAFVGLQLVFSVGAIVQGFSIFVGQLIALGGAAVPVLAVAGALAALAYAIHDLEGFGDAFNRGFFESLELAKDAWGGLVAAIQNGDFETAGKIAFKGLEVGFKTAMVAITSEWDRVVTLLPIKLVAGMSRGVTEMMLDAQIKYYDFLNWLGGTNNWTPEMNRIRKLKTEELNLINEQLTRDTQNAMVGVRARMDTAFAELEPVRSQLRDLAGQGKFPDPERIFKGRNKEVYAAMWGIHSAQLPWNTFGLNVGPNDFVRDSNDPGKVHPASFPGASVFGAIGSAAFDLRSKEAVAPIVTAAQEVMRLNHQARQGIATPELPAAIERLTAAVNNANGYYPQMVEAFKKQVVTPIEVSAQVKKAVQEFDDYMLKQRRPFTEFTEDIKKYEDAYRGPVIGLGALGGGLTMGNPIKSGVLGPYAGAIISKEQLGDAQFMEYNKLTGKMKDIWAAHLPAAAMRGSREAIDVINRSETQPKTVEEEVLRTLTTSQAIQEQSKEYQRQVVEILSRRPALTSGSGVTITVKEP